VSLACNTILLGALLAASLGGCGPADATGADTASPTETAPGLLLITLDTTRADRLGAYGHASARTPVIDALAARGLRFTRAYAPTPITLPSHASILTGTLPTQHGVRDNTGYALGEDAELVSEALAERGWRTMAAVGSFVLDPRFGLDQGFERYTSPRSAGVATLGAVIERRADAVVQDALDWLADVEPDEPFFLWLHLYDPHAPYEPPPALGAPTDAYDAEIAYCDHQLGRLLDALDRAGRGSSLSVVLSADHGESLGEHGESTHGVFLYEGALRVPLIVAGPAVAPGVVDQLVGTASVAATLLQLAGAPAAALPHATAPSLLGDRREAQLYLETVLPWRAHGWHPQRGVVWQDGKYVQGRTAELYALDSDPDERRNLAAEQPQQLGLAADRLARILAEHPALGWQRDAELESSDRAALAALGYLGGAATSEPPWSGQLPDPGERLEDLALRDEALWLLRAGRREIAERGVSAGQDTLSDARTRLIELRRRAPADAQVAQLLGYTEMMLGLYAEAARTLEQHALLRPAEALTRYNLAICYVATDRPEWALTEMMRAIALEPGHPDGYRWLVSHHLARDEIGHAAWWYGELLGAWQAPAAEQASLQAAIETLASRAASRGQPLAPPDGYPAAPGPPSGLTWGR
jgi:arylsulfatase A-like enzyme